MAIRDVVLRDKLMAAREINPRITVTSIVLLLYFSDATRSCNYRDVMIATGLPARGPLSRSIDALITDRLVTRRRCVSDQRKVDIKLTTYGHTLVKLLLA